MFQSEFRKNEPVITDADYSGAEVASSKRSFGLVPRDFKAIPRGSSHAAPELKIPRIPRNEWIDRIEEMEKTKTRLSDFVYAQNVNFIEQNGLSYCWNYGPGNAIKGLRAYNGQPDIDISPTAVGAIIKNYRNVGGWGLEAMELMAEMGVPTSEFWPHHALQKKYDTPEMRENAALHKGLEWADLEPGVLDDIATCVLNRLPCPVGFNWWGHEVAAFDLVHKDGQFGIRIRNSWVGYGDFGFGILMGRKAIPDDAQVLMSTGVSAS